MHALTGVNGRPLADPASNAQNYQQHHSAAALRSLPALHAIAHRLQSTGDVASLAQESIAVLESLLGYRYGAILLVEADRLVPFALSDQGRGAGFRDSDMNYVASRGIRVGEGITGWVARHGMPVRTGDVRTDPRYVAMRDDIRSELCVPIRTGSRILGVINVETPQPDAYSDEDRLILEVVAAQIGLALEMHRMAGIDATTGIPNRRTFDEVLPREFRRAARAGHAMSLLMIDVDHFKAYNDASGHLAGDRCLRQVAAVLSRGTARSGELLARFGGEEFAAILPLVDHDRACTAAERLRAGLSHAAIPHPASPLGAFVTASIGVACARVGKESPEGLIERADQALYRAKALGRNRVEGEL